MTSASSEPKKINIQYPPGLYQVALALPSEQVAAAIASQDLKLFHLQGANIHDKQTFINSLAKAAEFPDYAQANWDSLEECLRDLEWCPASGYVIFYQGTEPFQTAAPDDWQTALEILSSAVEFWQRTNTPMYVFLE